MKILGLSSFTHDAAAALLRDGVVSAAIEDSKLIRTNSHALPETAARFCLDQQQLEWNDLDVIAVATRPIRGWLRNASLPLRHSAWASWPSAYYQANQLGLLARQLSELRQLRRKQKHGLPKIICLEHHLTHAASAFFQSAYDRALVLTLDGGTDGKAGLISLGEGHTLTPLQNIAFPHSIAWVFSQVTKLLGFVPNKDEHKTQWLSLEGEPSLKNVFLDMMRESGTATPRLNRKFLDCDATGQPKLSQHFHEQIGIPDKDGVPDDNARRVVASSLQHACFEVVRDLIHSYFKKTGVDRVCLAGGLFQNVVLVAALEREFGFDNVFVPPAPGNAGCSVGAGLYVWHHLEHKSRQEEVSSVYWGPRYQRQEIAEVLTNSKARYSFQNTDDKRLDLAIQILQSGKILGWFQGAIEFGPRALGNRSLLASPWAPYVKENLNDYIKHREWFRPFALAVPEEDCDQFFVCSRSCRFMNSLGRLKPGSTLLPEGFTLPGDQVRVQIVSERSNPLFWRLLKKFGAVAPAPILINTSFNLAGEPLVARPQDALRSYFCSGVDALLIDNFLLSKSPIAQLEKVVVNASPFTYSHPSRAQA